jgi:hypothetical protein
MFISESLQTNFCSQQFLYFVSKQPLDWKLAFVESFDKKGLCVKTSTLAESEKARIDAMHRACTNNGKGLIRFAPGGAVSTQDERLRLAVYQSTYRDLN